MKPKIPEGSIVNAEVTVVQYLNPEDGAMKVALWFDGDVPLSSFLGLLDLAKIDLIRRSDP